MEKALVHEGSEQGRDCVGAGIGAVGEVDSGVVLAVGNEAGVSGPRVGLPSSGKPRAPYAGLAGLTVPGGVKGFTVSTASSKSRPENSSASV